MYRNHSLDWRRADKIYICTLLPSQKPACVGVKFCFLCSNKFCKLTLRCRKAQQISTCCCSALVPVPCVQHSTDRPHSTARFGRRDTSGPSPKPTSLILDTTNSAVTQNSTALGVRSSSFAKAEGAVGGLGLLPPCSSR